MRALDRLLTILEVVAESPQPPSMTIVSELSGLSLQTTSRLLRSLSEAGLLSRVEGGQRVRLGSRLLALADRPSVARDLTSVALDTMRTIRDEVGETTSLHIRVDGRRVCIAEVQSRHELRRIVPIGMSLPLHIGPTGRALLAGLSEDDRSRYVEQAGLPPAFQELVGEVAGRGWEWAADERTPGVSGLSIMIPGGDSVAALSVSGPSARWTESAMREHLGFILPRAQAILSPDNAAL